MRCVVMIAASLHLAACSALTVEPQWQRRSAPESMPRCSASRVPVAADFVISLFVAATYASASGWLGGEGPHAEYDARSSIAAGGMVGAFTVSGLYGLYQRRRCEEARDTHERMLAERAYGAEGAWRVGAPGAPTPGESARPRGQERPGAGVEPVEAPVEAPVDEVVGGGDGADAADGVQAGDEPGSGVDAPAGEDAEEKPRSEDGLIVDPWEPRSEVGSGAEPAGAAGEGPE